MCTLTVYCILERGWRSATEDGIIPACLDDPQVMKAIGDSNKDMDQLYLAIQMANDLVIHAPMMDGYNAQWLKAMLKKKEVEESICVPNTAVQWEQLAVALGHGRQFHASNNMNINNNNILKDEELGSGKGNSQ